MDVSLVAIMHCRTTRQPAA